MASAQSLTVVQGSPFDHKHHFPARDGQQTYASIGALRDLDAERHIIITAVTIPTAFVAQAADLGISTEIECRLIIVQAAQILPPSENTLPKRLVTAFWQATRALSAMIALIPTARICCLEALNPPKPRRVSPRTVASSNGSFAFGAARLDGSPNNTRPRFKKHQFSISDKLLPGCAANRTRRRFTLSSKRKKATCETERGPMLVWQNSGRKQTRHATSLSTGGSAAEGPTHYTRARGEPIESSRATLNGVLNQNERFAFFTLPVVNRK